MTIITKSVSEKKHLEKPLVINEVTGVIETRPVSGSVSDASNEDVEAWLSPSARRRVSTTTTICAFIMSLLIMSLSIIGGVYLYRKFCERKMSRFQGWCGIPYEKSSLHIVHNDNQLGFNKPLFQEAEWMPHESGFLKEALDLDLESNAHMEISAPMLGKDGYIHITHNFITQKTWYIQNNSRRCFFKKMDSKTIARPRDLLTLVRNMRYGVYKQNISVINDKMRAIKIEGKLGDLEEKCRGFDIYHLVPIQEGPRKKRDASTDKGQFSLAEFSGVNIMETTIYLPDDIE